MKEFIYSAARREFRETEEGNGFQDTIRFLLGMGGDFHPVNNCGENLLHTLASRDFCQDRCFDEYGSNLTLFKIFVRNGVDPLVQNRQGCPALVSGSIRTGLECLRS